MKVLCNLSIRIEFYRLTLPRQTILTFLIIFISIPYRECTFMNNCYIFVVIVVSIIPSLLWNHIWRGVFSCMFKVYCSLYCFETNSHELLCLIPNTGLFLFYIHSKAYTHKRRKKAYTHTQRTKVKVILYSLLILCWI